VLEHDEPLFKSAGVDGPGNVSSQHRISESRVKCIDDVDQSSVSSTVAILLCTKDGKVFLREQLESIRRQSHAKWRIVASDDGSSDRTLEILEEFAKRWPEQIEIRKGPQRGFCQNFLSLATDPAIRADYFAYCDQDDIWKDDKLNRALAWLQTIPRSVPALYCARVKLVSGEGEPIGHSPLFERAPGFRNALVQNIGGGNTMVFNGAARELLIKAGQVEVVSHDWWTYQLITACGGVVHYDPKPVLRYRQHTGNQIGSQVRWVARPQRLRMLLSGRFKRWNDANIRALKSVESILEPENRQTLEKFCEAREATLLSRLVNLRRSGVYRQTVLSNLSLIAAVLFRKM
jgi:glycosyltransferase involved in cell wall biosynthesis